MNVKIHLGVLIGSGMLCDRPWRMHTFTRPHMLVISLVPLPLWSDTKMELNRWPFAEMKSRKRFEHQTTAGCVNLRMILVFQREKQKNMKKKQNIIIVKKVHGTFCEFTLNIHNIKNVWLIVSFFCLVKQCLKKDNYMHLIFLNCYKQCSYHGSWEILQALYFLEYMLFFV